MDKRKEKEIYGESTGAADFNRMLMESPGVRAMRAFAYPSTDDERVRDEQFRRRLRAGVEFLGRDAVKKILIDQGHYLAKIRSGEKVRAPLRDLQMLMTRPCQGEGDYCLAILAYPLSREGGLVRLANINFVLLPDALVVTGMQGCPSCFNKDALNRFGRDLLDGPQLFEKLKKSLADIKPFNALMGLLLEMCLAKGIPTVRGLDKFLVKNSSYGQISHSFAGTYCSCGLRATGTAGIYEAPVRNRADLDFCFGRIVGKNPAIREKKAAFFNRLLAGLREQCPFLYEKNLQQVAAETRRKVDTSLSEPE